MNTMRRRQRNRTALLIAVGIIYAVVSLLSSFVIALQ
ncbi:putative nucleic acid-binding Zn ribbon protein [Lysobacter sp. HA18]